MRENTLAAYHAYLAEHLRCLSTPSVARAASTRGSWSITSRLSNWFRCRRTAAAVSRGFAAKRRNHKVTLELPLAECGVREENPNCQLVNDYAYWYVNWR